jgi:hypothetical protein
MGIYALFLQQCSRDPSYDPLETKTETCGREGQKEQHTVLRVVGGQKSGRSTVGPRSGTESRPRKHFGTDKNCVVAVADGLILRVAYDAAPEPINKMARICNAPEPASALMIQASRIQDEIAPDS